MKKIIILSILVVACSQQEKQVAQEQPSPPPAPVTAAPAEAAAIQEQTIDVAGEFTPASVTLKAGQPARLHFRRSDKPTCADEIVFPELGVRKKLGANQTATVDVPAQSARTLTFACGMNMMKGAVVVQ